MIAPSKIVGRCNTLKRNWSSRAIKFKKWYDILLLVDELEQPGIESVTTNDPRTGYNLAKHLLISMIIAHKIPSDELDTENIPATSYLEAYIDKRWTEQEKRYRSIGRQSWLGDVVSWLLACGWYSVFSMVDEEKIWAEVWSPAECFPSFGPEGLVEHAHIYSLPAAAANRKMKLKGWNIRQPFVGNITFYDHWGFDDDGDVVNSIVASNVFVKEPIKDPYLTKLNRLPIFTSPTGGLPDTGSIVAGDAWQEHCGESIIATNEDLNRNYNKIRSFYQQAARSAAQHHWLELSQGETPIATDEVMSRWGSVLHGQPGESVSPIQPPIIPVELTNLMYTYQNELSRGLFPPSVFGNIQQQMTYLAMANVASASLQVLTPYINAIKGLMSDIDNFWSDMIIKNGFRPYKFSMPGNMPKEFSFDVDANVEIPGYLIQRATVSRMLNPNFRLPESWITERMFPEIRNVLKSQAQVRSEDAMMHPKAILVDQIIAYREQARILRDGNDIPSAELYEKLAKSLEAELEPRAPAQAVPSGAAAPSVPQEVTPKGLLTPLEELGRTQ